MGSKSIETKALINSGAKGIFINKKLVEKENLPTIPLSCPITAKNVDNSINQQGLITQFTYQIFSIGGKYYLD